MLTLGASPDVGVPGVSRPAVADAAVVPPGAVRVVGAVARVLALLVHAGQGVDAVLVAEALVGPAAGVGVRVRDVVLVAPAPRVVPDRLAEGVHAALLVQARVLAVAVDARLVVTALVVALAAGWRGGGEEEKKMRALEMFAKKAFAGKALL